LRQQPEQYDHIWNGGYVTVVDGAYYAKDLIEARAAGRIGRVSPDPLMTYRLFFDIGGTGARPMRWRFGWCSHRQGSRALDYYEAVGQPLATHLTWMRERGYTPGKSDVWLPHDGDTHDKVMTCPTRPRSRSGIQRDRRAESGQGRGEGSHRSGPTPVPVRVVQRGKTQGGLDALGWYHEKKDESGRSGSS